MKLHRIAMETRRYKSNTSPLLGQTQATRLTDQYSDQNRPTEKHCSHITSCLSKSTMVAISAFSMQVIYMVLGSLGLIGNTLILLVGVRHKDMRHKEYHYPYALAFGEWILCASILYAGVHRMYYVLNDSYGVYYTKYDCLFRLFAIGMHLSFLVVAAIQLAICIDRMICLFKPLYYFGMTGRQTKAVSVAIVTFSFLYCVMEYVVAIAWVDLSGPMHVHCTPGNVFHQKTVKGVRLLETAGNTLTIIAFIIMAARMQFFEKNKALNKADGVREVVMQRNQRVTKMLFITLTYTLFLSCIPGLLITMSSFAGDGKHYLSIVWLQIITVMKVVNSANNIGIYMWKNKEMRVAIYSLLGLKQLMAKEIKTKESTKESNTDGNQQNKKI